MAEADPHKSFEVTTEVDLSALADRAHAGEEIVLAKAGVPWAKIVPYADAAKPKREPGGWPELRNIPDSVWFDPLPEEELALWEGKRLEKYGL